MMSRSQQEEDQEQQGGSHREDIHRRGPTVVTVTTATRTTTRCEGSSSIPFPVLLLLLLLLSSCLPEGHSFVYPNAPVVHRPVPTLPSSPRIRGIHHPEIATTSRTLRHAGWHPHQHQLVSTTTYPSRRTSSFLVRRSLVGWDSLNSLSSTAAVNPWNTVLGLTASSWTIHTILASQGPIPLLPSFALNAILFAALQSKLSTMLTPSGFVHALLLGTCLWNTLGWKGWTTAVVYLFLGQAVTKLKFQDKEQRGLAEKRGGRRGPENVWGSAATALCCAILTALSSNNILPIPLVSPSLLLLGFVASLATKLADTFASEIGKAYGKTTFLITTLERVEPGTEGAISLEGTAAAVVGGFALSLYGYGIGLLSSPLAVAVSTIAAFVATNVESVLGATLQEKQGLEWMSNEVINFFNTLIGAILAILLGLAFL